MEYELVHEIKNLCRNNQMRDVFLEELPSEAPERWLREKLMGKEIELTVEPGRDGAVTIHAVVDGLIQKFVFTPV